MDIKEPKKEDSFLSRFTSFTMMNLHHIKPGKKFNARVWKCRAGCTYWLTWMYWYFGNICLRHLGHK